jgi:hypothetical protein
VPPILPRVTSAKSAHFVVACGKIGSPTRRLRRSLTRSLTRSAPPRCAPSVFEQKEGTMSVSFYLGNLKDGVTTIDFVKDLDIDMSNGRARMVLNALGIPDTDDLCGQMDRVQFANLCLPGCSSTSAGSQRRSRNRLRTAPWARPSSTAAFRRATSISGFGSCRRRRGRQMTATSSIGLDAPEQGAHGHSGPPGLLRAGDGAALGSPFAAGTCGAGDRFNLASSCRRLRSSVCRSSS